MRKFFHKLFLFGRSLALLLLTGTLLIAALPLPAFARSASPLPSRALLSDAGGYYHLPAGLADDFPEETTTPEKIRNDLEVVHQTGGRYFRFGIGWDSIEIAPGVYEWGFWDALIERAGDYGIVLLPYVCYTPAWLNADPTDYWRNPPADLQRFGAFMYAIASRYRGQVASWELWNEPDIEHYWTGSAAQFAEMVREGARQVRRADPEAVIVLGGMARGRSPFLEALLQQHDLGKEIDVVSVHGYFETWDPAPAEEYPQKLQAVRDLIAATAPHLDLWLAEFGYSDYRRDCNSASEWVDIRYRYEHTEEYQAVALWKHHVLVAASEDVSLTTWYRIHDLPEAEGVIGDDNNKHLGILNVFGDPKPAFYALRFFNRIFDRPFRPVPVPVERPVGSQAQVHAFEENDGSWIITAWLPTTHAQPIADSSGWAKDPRVETIAIDLPISGPARWQTYLVNGKPERSGIVPANGVLDGIKLTGGAVYIVEVVRENFGLN